MAEEESQVSKSIRFKDTQVKLLTDQNSLLLQKIQDFEKTSETNATEKKHLMMKLSEITNVLTEVKSNEQFLEGKKESLEKLLNNSETKLSFVSNQNDELIKLAKQHEKNSSKSNNENEVLRSDVKSLNNEVRALKKTFCNGEKMIKTMQVEKKEMSKLNFNRLKKIEILSQQVTKLERSYEIEVESLNEQLRIRKQHHYNLLEKLNKTESQLKTSDESNESLLEKLRNLSTNLIETKSRVTKYEQISSSKENSEMTFKTSESKLRKEIESLQQKSKSKQKDVHRLEEQHLDSTTQIRSLGEKVFELLEKLKVCEVGRTKNLELVRKKDSELTTLTKKIERLTKELSSQHKQINSLNIKKEEQNKELKVLRTSMSKLNQKYVVEVKEKMNYCAKLEKNSDENKTLVNRIQYLIVKLRDSKDYSAIDKEKIQDLWNKVKSLEQKIETTTKTNMKLVESKQMLADALRVQQFDKEKVETELKIVKARLLSTSYKQKDLPVQSSHVSFEGLKFNNDVLVAKESFKVVKDYKNINGLIMIIPKDRAQKSKQKDLLRSLNLPQILTTIQASKEPKTLLLNKINEFLNIIYSLREKLQSLLKKNEDLKQMEEKTNVVESNLLKKLMVVEESKRKLILRYVSDKVETITETFTKPFQTRKINLRSCNLFEDECHAVCAVLKNFYPMKEVKGRVSRIQLHVDLSNNCIDDVGVKAFGTILSDIKKNSEIKFSYLDLKENKITEKGVESLVAMLKNQNEVIRHVHVHSGGKIEAMGTLINDRKEVKVETLFIIDCRNPNLNVDSLITYRPPTLKHTKEQKNLIKERLGNRSKKTSKLLELNQQTTKQERKKRLSFSFSKFSSNKKKTALIKSIEKGVININIIHEDKKIDKAT